MVLFGAKGETLELATAYTRIIAIGAPFQILGAGSSMLIRADGSPKYAMASTLIGAVLNIILDPIFIFTLDIFMFGTLINGITVLVSNSFPAIGMAREGTIASLSRQVLFQLPLLIVFPLIWGLNGVLFVGPVSDFAAMFLCLLLVRKTLKMLQNTNQ